MRIALGQLDLRALSLAAAGEPPPYQLLLREAQGVRGELVRDAGKLALRELGADRLVLDALRLLLGTLTLRSPHETLIEQLRGELLQSVAQLELTLHAKLVEARPLEIAIAELTLAGQTVLHGVTLHSDKDRGSLKVERLEVRELKVSQAGLSCSSGPLSAEGFELAWGMELRLLAARLELSELSLQLAQGAELTLRDAGCSNLSLRGARLSVGELQIGRARLKAPLRSASAPAPRTTPPPPTPLVREPAARRVADLSLLDGLSGSLQVDAHVDVTIPIFGTRRAKHKLRLTVDEGSVDYRELEEDLAPLESSLLDFSVRGDELVLERGIPLLPTRGFGKPILIWPLSPRDQALAARDRVRLALLPNFQLARKDDEEDDDNGRDDDEAGKSALRKLALNNIDLQLSLQPGTARDTALRGASIEHLSAKGTVRHRIDEYSDASGLVSGAMRGLALSLEELALGTRELSLHKLKVARVPHWQLRFEGLTPSALEIDLEGIAIVQLSLV
jgi:hypothetical protein